MGELRERIFKVVARELGVREVAGSSREVQRVMQRIQVDRLRAQRIADAVVSLLEKDNETTVAIPVIDLRNIHQHIKERE